MKYLWINQELKYDGRQLKSLFGYLQYKLMGDSFLAFEGPCDVSFDHMVDGEDFLAGSAIKGARMLHFIVEEFGISLELAVTRQRLLAGIVFENILVFSPELASQLRRSGDDIFVGDAKLSISIATVSPVSGLIHFAMNIVNDGTPVKTCALSDFKINSKSLAQQIAAAYLNEVKTIKEACTKVHWVK